MTSSSMKKTKHGTLSSNSVLEYSNPIPVDLLIDIFSRVPAKSIVKFRSVSKSWASILGRHDFTELFLTMSWTYPRMLFTFQVGKEFFLYSSPQPHNEDEDLSLVVTPYKKFSAYFLKYHKGKICSSLSGLVCLHCYRGRHRVICNPATGNFSNLPKLKAKVFKTSLFGFDPISRQYKVLCLAWSGQVSHMVLTLESGNCLWRTIHCPISYHFRGNTEICINGVLYYIAVSKDDGSYLIIAFDVSAEKFGFIKMDEDMLYGITYCWTLLNYKGKVSLLYWEEEKLVLWVLEDATKHKWSRITSMFPQALRREMFSYSTIVGMTSAGEIVFSPYHLSSPLCLQFYNLERNIFTRVNVHGFGKLKRNQFIRIHTFLDYVENMRLT